MKELKKRKHMIRFAEELIENYKNHFSRHLSRDFSNQHAGSCLGLFGLAMAVQPDRIVELGTGHGASAITWAAALTMMNKPIDRLTIIDRTLDFWKDATENIQNGLLDEYNIDVNRINAVEHNILDADPTEYLNSDEKILLFYDLHDTDRFYSHMFLENWIPLIKRGVVVFHDFLPVDQAHCVDNSKKAWLRTKAMHCSGQAYTGFGEVAPIIWWLNQNNIQIAEFDSGIWYDVEQTLCQEWNNK